MASVSDRLEGKGRNPQEVRRRCPRGLPGERRGTARLLLWVTGWGAQAAGEEEQVEGVIGHPRDVPGGRADRRGGRTASSSPGPSSSMVPDGSQSFQPLALSNKDPFAQCPLQSGAVGHLSSGQQK